nr:hypothetical protein [Candidatus Freyarchaeota archaeon]
MSKDENPQVCYRGEDTIITVRMLNSSDPIIGEQTFFYDQSNDMLIGIELTNSSGYAVLDWGIPHDYPLGLTTIRAICPNRPDAIPVYTDLFVKAKTVFENLTYPTSVYTGEYLVVEVDLLDNSNNTISNQQVHLYDYQNTNLTQSTTDTFGHCVLSCEIPTDMVPGLYSFKVKFEDAQLYNSTEREFNVTVLSQALEIVSITLNSTRVKPNTPILVNVEINRYDALISVKINDSLLEKTEGNSWEGTINSPSMPGKYLLNVIVYYNGTQRINDSSTYYIVEGEALDFSAGTLFFIVDLLLFSIENDSLTNEIILLSPVSALAIISAAIAWKKKKRQPSFSRDYTLEGSSNFS